MRIADVLSEQDAGDGEISGQNSSPRVFSAASGGSSCRSLLSKLFRNRWKRAPTDSEGKSVIYRPESDGILTGKADSSCILPEIDFSSGIKPNDIAFNLGMGIGMAFVLAGNSNEMNKMVELRRQMEMLLKEIKAEVQRRDDSSLKASSDTGEDEISITISAKQNSSSLDMEETKYFAESNSKNYQPIKNLSHMDQMEEELRVELERMELNFEGDAGKHKMENNKENDLSSESSRLAWYDHIADANNETDNGVCANDLERRLHELLQTRQQERIEALESALELAHRKLNERECELCNSKKIGGFIHENEESYFSLSFK